MAADTSRSGAPAKLGSIVCLVYGSGRYHDQARFSVLTFLDLMLKAQRSDIDCVVYSDRRELVPAHPLVQTMPLSTEQLKAWRGPLDFVHRVKLEMLRHAIRHFGAPLLFVDTDTRWLKVPDAQFMELGRPPQDSSQKPTLYLHVKEGVLSPRFHPRYFQSLQPGRAARKILPSWEGEATWEMWNAGAIGIPVGAENFLEETLELCDKLLLYLRPRIYVEQLSLSLLGTRKFAVKPIDDCIHHYWGVSAEFEQVLRDILPGMQALPLEQQAGRAGALIWDEASLRGSQFMPAHRLKMRLAKMRSSIHKRSMDLKALYLRWITATSRR